MSREELLEGAIMRQRFRCMAWLRMAEEVRQWFRGRIFAVGPPTHKPPNKRTRRVGA